MSYPNAFARLNLAWAALRRRLKPTASNEIIRFVDKSGSHVVCQMVSIAIGGRRNVVFISVAGSPNDPAAHIEGLASSAFRDLGAPAASLVFWTIDSDEWDLCDERVTIHRLEFTSFADGRFSGPKWIPEAMPDALAKQVARAQHELFPNSAATVPGGRR